MMKQLFEKVNELQEAIYNDGFIYGIVLGSALSLTALAIAHAWQMDRKEKRK